MTDEEEYVISAARELVKAISEEDAHDIGSVMSDAYGTPEEITKWDNFVVKLLDLAQAVQDYEP